MSGDIHIVPLSRRPADVRRFLQVSDLVYRDDPFWVAPLLADLKLVFGDRNPFFEHAEMQLWVAQENGRDVGRIAGILDRTYNQCQTDCAGFFGFFESLPEPQVSHQLFEAVCAWARQKNLRRLLGPMNPTINDECGLLIDGFDSPPVLMMSYNPRYYVDLIAAEGFQKAKDLLAFQIDVANSPKERLERISAGFNQRRSDVQVRPILRRTLSRDLAKIKEVYNAAWQKNWGFVPMTDAEVNFLADRLKPLLMEQLAWIAETDAEPAAFMLALPDFNEALKPLRGRLLSPGLPGFLFYLLGWKRPAQMRVVALGIKKKFRGRGIESVMFARGLQCAMLAGFRFCEASWILEDNVAVQRLIELFGGKAYKTYRIFERNL